MVGDGPFRNGHTHAALWAQGQLAFRIARPILAHRLAYAASESAELQRFNQFIAVTRGQAMYPAIITHRATIAQQYEREHHEISHGCSNILILLDEAVSDTTKLDQAGKAMPGRAVFRWDALLKPIFGDWMNS